MEADILEHILDGREKPTNLPFTLLKNITDNFSEDRVIGQGGFATVYEGVLPNGRVAVKRIRNNHSIDEKLFYREVDSLLAVDHQNVVRFLGFCASTDQTAIKLEGSRQHIYAEIRERLLCFEYMSNGSLQKHITDELRGLEWDTRYQIIKGICEGLHHLHKEKQIYHMDLKPANILLDNHMIPKITDFGLSRLDEKSQTMSEGRGGSFGYCAPEYLLSGKMSFKSDMFSLGVIITELVTGDKGIPHNNKNNVLRRWRHRWKKLEKETPLNYQQVAKCIEIGLLCQEIDPSKRPFIWDLIHDIREMEGVNGEVSNAYKYTCGQISPYSEDGMLVVEPIVLHFPFQLNKQISCSLQLTNHTDAYIAFNILNMSPLPYCTQPNKDIAPPRSKCSVDITLQAQDKAPRDVRHADEFIVWSTKVDAGLSPDDITTNMFSKESVVVDVVNLDVVFYAEESTNVNDGQASEDITTNMSNKETCVVNKMPVVASPNTYPGGTSLQPAEVLPSQARSTPRKLFNWSFPPSSLAKHIKTTLAKRLGGEKPKEGMIPEEGVVGAAASGGPASDWAEAKIPLDKTFGFRTNFSTKYELRKEVGRGHFAHVYSAFVKKGKSKGQTIAAKIISKAEIRTLISIDDVRREVKILKALSGHNNLVKFYDACEDASNVYIVMELCEGGELLERILARGGRYTEEDAKAIVVEILSALAFCHLQGVVHRDLKPENFLFTTRHENAPMKLIDFGLSDFVRPDERLNDIVGSAYYVAPEVLHRSYSTEADIWSIGVITYILLGGSRPFWAQTESGIFRSVLRADPNFDDSPWPSVSAEAKDFVKRFLNKDYRKRMTAVQALTHPWLRVNQRKIPLDILIYRLIRQYLRATPFKQLALKALSKALEDDELLYLRLQFNLLEPRDGIVTLDNFRTALTLYLADAVEESRILELLHGLEPLRYTGSMDFEEFCAATISPYQLEALDRWEEIARTAFQHFEQEANRVISVEELAQELNLDPSHYSIVQDCITGGKLNFYGFTKYLHGVIIRGET